MPYQAHIKLADAVAYPGAPRCFRRVWDPPQPHDYTETIGGEVVHFVTMPGPIVVYGYASRSTFREDWPREEQAWKRGGTFLATCFSEQFPDPEIGFVRLEDAEEIPETELRAQAARLGVIV